MWGWFKAAWKIAVGTIGEIWRPNGGVLDEIARRLGGEAQRAVASGKQRGVSVTFRFATRGSGSDGTPWTEIEADLPPYPLAIHVQRPSPGGLFRDDALEGQPGRLGFVASFSVAAAPEDVARALLDARVRRMLSVYSHVELDTVTGERRLLRLAIRGWIEDVAEAMHALDEVALLSVRLRDIYAAIETAVPAQLGGAPYRPQLDDEPLRDAYASRTAEVTRLEARRARRRSRETIAAMVITAILLGYLVASMIWR